MLTYLLLSINDKESIFLYFPNGNKNAPGKIRIDAKGTRELVSESDDDFGQRYANHALNGIDPNKESGTIAWY